MIPQRRTAIVTAAVLAAAILGGGCREERVQPPAAGGGSVAGTTASDTALPLDTTQGVQWDAAAGRALVLSVGGAAESAAVVRPEYVEGAFNGPTLAAVRPFAQSRWDLFGRSGFFGSAQLTPGTALGADEGCTAWPPAMLSTAKSGWRAALEAGRATAVPLDSVEAMSRGDSARFVIAITRLAASAPGANDPLFASIPFVVRNAYQFRTNDIEGVIASVQRSILSEANPREEQLFLIAERPVGSTNGYRIAYTTRAAGSEGGAPVVDVLAAVVLSVSRRVALIVSHEYEDGGEVWWLERSAPGHWQVTWRSAAIGC